MTTEVSRVITAPIQPLGRPEGRTGRVALPASLARVRRVTTAPDDLLEPGDLGDPTTDPFAVAAAAAAVIAERTGAERHDIALVLGSGWGSAADLIGETIATIDNDDVPGFHRAAVEGHSGSMRSIEIGDTGRRALVFGTRTHFYEGRAARRSCTASAPPRPRGCRRSCSRTVAVGLNRDWAPGTPVLIRDHLTSPPPHPSRGRTSST